MAFAPFNVALQVIAAFVIFIVGYVALFVSILVCVAICLAIAKGIYEAARRVRAYAVRSAPAKTFTSSDVTLTPGLDSRSLIRIGGRS
jgi:hypothetical protein